MPHKFNAAGRDKIPKQKHRVTNWPEYNEGLRQRGDLTVWISEDALSLWSAPRRTTRGGQPHYSDLAIEMCLTLGLAFKQSLRQTQGLMRSIARLLGVAITVPDFSTLSRRGNGLTLRPKPKSKCDKPVQLVVDSTGLQIFGEGDWLEEKHKARRKRRSWRKLHLGLILSVARSFALISPRMTSVIQRCCQISWIKSLGRSLAFWHTALTTETQHLICLPLGSDR